MAGENDSSSSTLGTIVWQTSMSLTDNATTPAISDSFVSDRWTESQVHQGLIKYTQYVDCGRTFDETTSSWHIQDVERVDFGWLEQPKFLCFSNVTQEGHAPTSIYVGMSNKEEEKNLLGITDDDKLPIRPAWFLAQQTEDEFGSTASLYIPEEASLDQSAIQDAVASTTCGLCIEVPPGMTIGPIMLPDGVDFWAYLEKTGEAEESSWSGETYGGILLTEAYDS